MLPRFTIACCVALLPAALQGAEQPPQQWPLTPAFLDKARAIAEAPKLDCPAPPAGEWAPPAGITLDEPDDRVVRAVRTAERARAEGKWNEAIAAYQVLLDDRVSSDFPGGDSVYIPADEFCRRRMLSLPADAVAAYRTMHDADAARRYARALEARSPALFEEVARTFPIASAALPALKYAADLRLERGEFTRALAAYRRIWTWLQPGQAVPFSPALLLVKTAACLKAAGGDARAADVRALLQTEAAPGPDAERAAALAETLAGSLSLEPAASPSWGTFGGGNCHAGLPGKVVLPGRLRWYDRYEPDSQQRDSLRVSRPELYRVPEMICHAAAADGMLYYRTETGVTAREIATGKTLWIYRETLADAAGNPLARNNFYARMRGGSLFLTADADRVYANIFYIAHEENRFQGARFKLAALNTRPDLPRLAWERAAQTETEDSLKDLSFISAPIVSRGRLYVGAMQVAGEEMYLCCFDAATGKLLWKTFICISQPVVRYEYKSGNGVGEMPAEKDGVIYFAPNFGVVAAVDADTGSPIWKSCYERPPARDPDFVNYVSFLRPNNPPVIHGDKLFVLPSDSDYLYAISLASGTVVWRHQVGNNIAYLLGVAAGQVVVSGDRVLAVSLDGSKHQPTDQLKGDATGRGLLAESFALCPTKEGLELVQLDNGRLVGVNRPYVSWKEWGDHQQESRSIAQSGNLLIADGRLIIVGQENVQVYDERVNAAEVLAKLKDTPDDPALHADLASYYLWQGKYTEAAAECETAHARLAETGANEALDQTVLGDLFTIYMYLGDAEFVTRSYAKALEFYRKAAARAPGEDSRLQAQVKTGEALALSGQVAAGIEVFQGIIEQQPEVQLHVDGYLTVQARAFAASRIGELIRQHGREAYAGFDRKAAEMLRTIDADAAALMQRYPNSLAADDCLLELARAAAAANDLAAARQHLWALLRRQPQRAKEKPVSDLAALCLKDAPGPGLKRNTSILPPLEQNWSFKTEAESNAPLIVEAPFDGDAAADLFYLILGKNIHCRRAQDGSLVWRNSAGWLGVQLSSPANNAQVMDVMPGMPADRAGLQPNDVILEFDGAPVRDTPELIRICGNTPAGKTVKMTISRNNAPIVLDVTLDERPAKHDLVDRGYRVFLLGMVRVDKGGDPQRVMLLSRDRFLQCVDPLTGDVLKKLPIDQQRPNQFAPAPPPQNDGLAIVGDTTLMAATQAVVEGAFNPVQPNIPQPAARNQGEIALWNLAAGEATWRRQISRRPLTDPCVVGEIAAVIEIDTNWQVYIGCYSVATGEPAAAIGPLPGVDNSPMGIFALPGNCVCVPVGGQLLCYRINPAPEAARPLWARQVGGAKIDVFQLLPAGAERRRDLIIAGTAGTSVQVIEADTGRALWGLPGPESGVDANTIRTDDRCVYTVTKSGADSLARAYDLETGNKLWEALLPRMPCPADLAVAEGHVVIGVNEFPTSRETGSSKVVVLDKATGKTAQEIQFRDDAVFRVRVVNGVLLVVTRNSVVGFASHGPNTGRADAPAGAPLAARPDRAPGARLNAVDSARRLW